MAAAMHEFKPAMPHGDLEEVFPGVFFVTGTTRPRFEGVDWQFSRNMTVVRDGDALTIINSVRLDDAGLQALERLGEVKHVIKLGAFHGYDDPFYVDRYRPTLWALPGMTHEGGLATDAVLGPDACPIRDASVFAYETVKAPEGLLVIHREGGVVIACDSLQNWAAVDRFFDEPSAAMMTQFGFIRPTNVGPGWARYAEPQARDFARVLELPFRHLLSAHGTPVVGDAKERYAATFRELYGVDGPTSAS